MKHHLKLKANNAKQNKTKLNCCKKIKRNEPERGLNIVKWISKWMKRINKINKIVNDKM